MCALGYFLARDVPEHVRTLDADRLFEDSYINTVVCAEAGYLQQASYLWPVGAAVPARMKPSDVDGGVLPAKVSPSLSEKRTAVDALGNFPSGVSDATVVLAFDLFGLAVVDWTACTRAVLESFLRTREGFPLSFKDKKKEELLLLCQRQMEIESTVNARGEPCCVPQVRDPLGGSVVDIMLGRNELSGTAWSQFTSQTQYPGPEAKVDTGTMKFEPMFVDGACKTGWISGIERLRGALPFVPHLRLQHLVQQRLQHSGPVSGPELDAHRWMCDRIIRRGYMLAYEQTDLHLMLYDQPADFAERVLVRAAVRASMRKLVYAVQLELAVDRGDANNKGYDEVHTRFACGYSRLPGHANCASQLYVLQWEAWGVLAHQCGTVGTRAHGAARRSASAVAANVLAKRMGQSGALHER